MMVHVSRRPRPWHRLDSVNVRTGCLDGSVTSALRAIGDTDYIHPGNAEVR